MSADRAAVREIDWLELFPWLGLAKTIRIAFGPSSLLLALLGMTLTTAGWLGISRTYARYWPDDPLIKSQKAAYYENTDTWRAMPGGVAAIAPSDALGNVTAATTAVGHSLTDLPTWYTRPFWQMFAHDSHWPAFSMAALCALWTVAVWAFFAGAISRLAALRLAQDRRLGLMRACRYAIAKWVSYFCGPLIPLAGVALLVVLPGLIAGWISRLDAGFVLVGALWPLGMVFALICAVMLVAALFDWPLMWAAVSTDASDSYDAFSRSFSYVSQRPFHVAFYVAVAALIGAAAWFFVAVIGELTIYLMAWGMSWSTGADRANEVFAATASLSTAAGGPTESTGGHLVALWSGLARMIVLAFGHSFLWTAASGTYLLLRRDTDGTPLDEVFPDAAEEPSGLSLQRDAAGATVRDEAHRPQPDGSRTP